MNAGLHPCDIGDLPIWVQLSTCSHLLPVDQRNLHSNWKSRYPFFIERRKVGGLWINVKKCDQWLDERGSRLLSPQLIGEKKRRNPGWQPAGDRLETLVGAQDEILNKLAILVAQRLHQNYTDFALEVGV